MSVALSEAEVYWRTFIDSLVRRGLKGVKLIVSDDHAGLKAARRAALPSVPWQRCQFHLQLNAQAYITRIDQRKPVAQRIRAIFNAPDKAEAERLLKQSLEIWAKDAPKLAQWADMVGQIHAERAFWIERADRAEIVAEQAMAQVTELAKRMADLAEQVQEAKMAVTADLPPGIDSRLSQILDRLNQHKPVQDPWWRRWFGVSKRTKLGVD